MARLAQVHTGRRWQLKGFNWRTFNEEIVSRGLDRWEGSPVLQEQQWETAPTWMVKWRVSFMEDTETQGRQEQGSQWETRALRSQSRWITFNHFLSILGYTTSAVHWSCPTGCQPSWAQSWLRSVENESPAVWPVENHQNSLPLYLWLTDNVFFFRDDTTYSRLSRVHAYFMFTRTDRIDSLVRVWIKVTRKLKYRELVYY